jgi:hypothetical protein
MKSKIWSDSKSGWYRLTFEEWIQGVLISQQTTAPVVVGGQLEPIRISTNIDQLQLPT